MRCTKCNAEIPEGNKFCTNCGSTISEGGDASAVTRCPRCNAEVPEGSKFCTACGSAVSRGSDSPSENGAQSENVFFNEAPVKAAKKKMSKKAKIITFSSIGAAAAAAVVLGVVFHEYVGGLCDRIFLKPEDHLMKVEEQGISDGAETIAMLVGSQGNSSARASVEIKAEDEFIELVEELSGEDLKEYLGDVRSAKLAVDVSVEDDLYGVKLDAQLSGTDIGSIEFVADDDSAYVGLPGLSSKYIKLDDETSGAFAASMAATKTVQEALPSGETLKNIIEGFGTAAMGEIKNVERSSEKVTVGDASAKYTVLEARIDEDTVRDMSKAVLNKAKDDQELKSLVKTLAEAVMTADGEDSRTIKSTLDEIDQSFSEDSIDEIIESLEDFDMDGQWITYKVYIDGKNTVMGRSISFDGGEIGMMSAAKGGRTVSELFVNGEGKKVFSILCDGKNTNKGFSGTVYISSMGVNAVNIDVTGFKLDAKAGICSGSGSIKLSDAAAALLNTSGIESEYADLIKAASIGFNFSSTKDKAYFELTARKGSRDLISLTIDSDKDSGYEPSLPSAGDVVDSQNDDDALVFIMSFDFNKLINNLDDAGLPSSVINELRMGVSYLSDSLYGGY